ncbi:MAG: L-rhamnonate dehydratase [Caldilineaceae bacterium]|jgi:L-rhamnonate dehydratase|nr:L-rhamnonate dehydratase [Caldilineaceae bacterium]
MKITSIQTVRLHLPPQSAPEGSRRSWAEHAEVANPMSRYPHVKRQRALWLPKNWGPLWCKVTAEDGTWGLGLSDHAPAVAAVIDGHLAPQLVGQDCLATEKLADMMFRLTKPYGTTGLASYAISAIDLALWDLKGKLLGKPVYSLLGGPARDKMVCYVTGNDIDWYQELGFRAFKLACPYGPADGLDGLAKNEEFVAQARERIGDACELMLDCWMAFDVEYAVRLAERLRPYKLRWLEECLIPEDMDGHIELRRRLPDQTLATGEHWYTHLPFQAAIKQRMVDILQPDINWCGGVTTCQKIMGMAEAAGTSVILHGGARNPYGQHFSYAFAGIPWLEYFIGSRPGVPLEQAPRLPGQPVAKDGCLTPSDAPGFGLEIDEAWLEAV